MAISTLLPQSSANEPGTLATDLDRLQAIAQYRDQNAFEAVYVAHQRSVKAAVAKLCRNPESVEEIVQRTFQALWERAERLAVGSLNVRAWLLTVARNAAIDLHRSERVSYVGLDVVAERATQDHSPLDLALADCEKARLMAALECLSPEQKRVIHFHYFQGYSFQKIATQIGSPLGTVKSRTYIALSRLRAQLAEQA